MNRPWQIWILFSAAVAMLVGAVGWLSHKALQSESAEALANRQARIDEQASLALWRMDSFMTPIVAQESARPWTAYNPDSFSQRGEDRATKGKPNPVDDISTGLFSPSIPCVLLHFQLDSNGILTSPEIASHALRQPTRGILPQETIAPRHEALFAKLQNVVGLPEKLASVLPRAPTTAISDASANQSTDNTTVIARELVNAGQQEIASAAGQIAQPKVVGPEPAVGQSQQAAQFPNANAPQQAANAPIHVPPQQTPVVQSQLDYPARSKSFAQGSNALQSMNFNEVDSQKAQAQKEDSVSQVSMMTPLWFGDDLILARRVDLKGLNLVQGCLLDWPQLKRQLLEESSDLLPHADLQPIRSAAQASDVRRLASLPAVLIPGDLPAEFGADAGLSPIKQSLLIAWAAMALAAVAVATLLRGVISLSERRAAFVSAVTHELRTPLTTFRMYAEMLYKGMVREESDRRLYLQTLLTESERLTHLVANVLAYARLERGRPGERIETLPVERLLEVAVQRLASRAEQAQLQLSIEVPTESLKSKVRADPAAVEQILFNLVDNACKYAATASDRILQLSVSSSQQQVCIRLRDHGAGISPHEQRRLFKPFHKSAGDAAQSAPGVGLGLALSRRLAREMGGNLQCESAVDGACFALTLPVAERPVD